MTRRRLLRTAARKARRALKRRIRRAWRRSLRRAVKWRRRQLARRQAAQRRRREAAAAASELAVRSITGKPRPAKATAPATPTSGPAVTKRTRDGKFNGSKSTRKAAPKKAVAKKTAVPAAQRDLARGDATLRRVESRLARTEKRIDKL